MVIATFAFIYFGILDILAIPFFLIFLAVCAPLFFGKEHKQKATNVREAQAKAEAEKLRGIQVRGHTEAIAEYKAEAKKLRNPKAEAERLRDELGHPEAF